jgi:hypothetical protein
LVRLSYVIRISPLLIGMAVVDHQGQVPSAPGPVIGRAEVYGEISDEAGH